MAIIGSIVLNKTLTTAWNGATYDDTTSYTVAVGVDLLSIRLGGPWMTPPTITYNGVTVPQRIAANDSNSEQVIIYDIINPSSGANDIVVDSGGAAGTWVMSVQSLDGVNTASPVRGSPASSGGFVANSSLVMTTVSDDYVVDVLSSPSATVGTGQAAQLLNISGVSASSETATTVSTTMSWTHSELRAVIAAVVYKPDAPSIDSVDSPVLDAETGNLLTTSGFASDVTSLVISDVATGTYDLDVSASLAGTAGSFTFDMPDVAGLLVNTAGTPFDSASHTHVITAGFLTESASAPIVVNPKAGWMVVEVESASMLVGSLFEDWTPTPPDGCQIYIPTADNTSATAAGILTTDRLTGTIDWMFFDIDTGLWEPHTVTLPSGGFLNRNYFWDNK